LLFLQQSYRTPPRLRSTVLKWLAITSVDLLLNAPDNLLRLAIMFADEEQPIWQWYMPVRFVSQLCYFAQFGFNACYLSLVVYNQSIKPKRFVALVGYCPRAEDQAGVRASALR
jgi:hypothetical protein